MPDDAPFRSDHEAALARADALERENEKLREELRDAQQPKKAQAQPRAPKRPRAPRTRLWRWRLPSRGQIAGGAAFALVALFFVFYPPYRAHKLLYTTPGHPLAGFIIDDEVVVIDEVASRVGGVRIGSTEDAGTRVTVLDAPTGKQLAVHVFPANTRCQKQGVSIWCAESGHPGARYDVPSFGRSDAPEPPAPDTDRSCKTEAPLEAHCEHAELVGKLLVITSLVPAKRAYAIDPETYHTVWTFGRTK